MTEQSTFTERVNRAGRPAVDQSNFSKGYQACLRDIQEKLHEGGAEAAQEWISNNLAS